VTIVERKVRYKEKDWRITVYSQNKTMKILSAGTKKEKGEVIIIEGGWNARTGREEGWIKEQIEEEEEWLRKSRTR